MRIKSIKSGLDPPPALSVVLLAAFPGPGVQGRMGRRKSFTTATEVHLVSSYSDKYTEMTKGWDLFVFHSSVLTERMEGKQGERREMFLFGAYHEIPSHRKRHSPTSSHSCIMVGKNLICKLLKARQRALIFCTQLSFLTSEKTTCK